VVELADTSAPGTSRLHHRQAKLASRWPPQPIPQDRPRPYDEGFDVIASVTEQPTRSIARRSSL
jgi:hypothetical protein